MGRYIARKAAWLVLVLLGVAVLTFLMGRLAPGDPVETLLSSVPNPTQEDRQQAEAYLGLNLPLPAQFAVWVGRIVRGDLGVSYKTGRAVAREMGIRLPTTLRLTGGATCVMLLFGFSIGILSAAYRGKWVDHLARVLNVVAISVPSFCFGILLILFFGVRLKLLPTMGNETLAHMILPSLAMGIGSGAGLARLLRVQLATAAAQEHVQAAKVFGVSPYRIFFNHVLKNALPPVLTQIGLMIGAMLGGSAIIETLFTLPGAGSYIVEAIAGRDYPVIQAYALLMAAVYVCMNTLIDIAHALMNPAARTLEGYHEA